MAEDTMKGREPGEEGSTQGQIETPMCSANVGNEGGGKTHSFKSVTKITGEGGTDIAGPGAKGQWDTQIKITGSNKKY